MSDESHLEKTVAVIEADLLPVAKAATSYEIVDPETMEGGINFLGKIKAAYDRVETTRKFFTAPLLELKKKYDGKFKPMLEELETAEKALKGKMVDYRLALPEHLAEKTTKASDAKATFVKVRKFRVSDASQVPKEYWKVDDDKIDKVVKAGLSSIPGVEIWEEEQVRGSYV